MSGQLTLGVPLSLIAPTTCSSIPPSPSPPSDLPLVEKAKPALRVAPPSDFTPGKSPHHPPLHSPPIAPALPIYPPPRIPPLPPPQLRCFQAAY
mmetsp:Transcript_18155/g.29834  ORF Transcript_18155/g.29834 Transcript_18155/m.29834 type:complete len:94 (+) Transcript_18155:427-708(+)